MRNTMTQVVITQPLLCCAIRHENKQQSESTPVAKQLLASIYSLMAAQPSQMLKPALRCCKGSGMPVFPWYPALCRSWAPSQMSPLQTDWGGSPLPGGDVEYAKPVWCLNQTLTSSKFKKWEIVTMCHLTFCRPVWYNYHCQRSCLLSGSVIDEVQQILEQMIVFKWEVRK